MPLVAAQVDTSREDQILRTAMDNIETSRKGTLQMQFVDSMTGSRLSDVEVQYQQMSHDFMFSTHFASDPARMQSVGLEWSGDVSLSWAEIEPSRGVYDFSKPNNAIRWLQGYSRCLSNWTRPACTTQWYKEVRLWAQFRSLLLDSQYPEAPRPPDFADFDHIADPAVFSRYKDLVYEFVYKVATVYMGKISAYVTQPGINWPGQAVAVGLSKQPAWTIHQAVELNKVVSKAIRDADPGAIVILGAATPWKGPSQNDVDALEFTKLCLDAGVDVDMVALEAWPSDGTPSFFYDYVKRLARFGKRIFIKETGYPSEEPTGESSWLKSGKWEVFDEHVQALWFRYIFTFAFGMKEVAGVGLNAVRDDVDWSVGVFTTTWEPKESATMLQRLLSNFTTSGVGRTDRDSVLALRGFAGNYTVQIRGYKPVVVHVSEGQNKVAITVSNSSIRTIAVTFSRTIGRIRSLQGINGGWALPSLYEQYRQMGVDYVRTHDVSGAFDIDVIFPHMDADPYQESSYDFRSTDLQVQAIRSIHAQVFYRLGYSWGGPNAVPSDYAKLAEICKHIVMHYNDGWANGFHYEITYWEIWNEPDYTKFWLGTPQEYFRLYDTVARALKTVDPNTKVGGPALAWNQTLLGTFLRFCRANDSPLDFVSWHIYPERPPYSVAETAQQIQGLLSTYGFENVENFLTEWNFAFVSGSMPAINWNATGAAWIASVLVYLQDTSISRAFMYASTSTDGQFDKTANSFVAMKNMLQSPIRLACSGSDNVGFATLAGRSENGGNLTVLVSDFNGEYDEFLLNVNDLPWQERIVVVRIYLSDETHDMALVERSERTLSGSLVLRHKINPSSVYLISVQAKEPSMETTAHSETTSATTPVGFIGQSLLLPVSAILGVVSVAVISYVSKKRAKHRETS